MAIKPVTLPAVIVGAPGQRKSISTTRVLVYSATIQSVKTNTGTQYIGDKTVTAANGQPMEPGGQAVVKSPTGGKEPEQFDISEVYVDSSTAGAEFRISAWMRV